MPRKLALLCLAAMVGMTAHALAAPPKLAAAPKPTADQQKRYKEALNRGRALQKKKDWTGAMAAFNESLAAIPNDATAYSEISVCAFVKKDYKLAESAARKSVAFASNPKLRAASLYNLGRVQEDRGEKAAAIESYSASLLDRPNKTVRERLLGLDPKAAAATDPLAPKAMEGPFASLEKWCHDSSDRTACEQMGEVGESAEGDENPAEFSCRSDQPAKTVDKPPAPYKEIRYFSTECSQRGGDLVNADYYLAIKLATGWYIAGNAGSTFNSMRQTDELTVEALEVKDAIPGGAPEVVLRTSTASDYRGTDSVAATWMNVAGVGASGRPSATAQILLARTDISTDFDTMDEKGNGKETTSGGTLEARFLSDGTLEIKGPQNKMGGGIDPDVIAPLVGKHQLLFP
jgi:tetratricopeptide (TPR) repeat protein